MKKLMVVLGTISVAVGGVLAVLKVKESKGLPKITKK